MRAFLGEAHGQPSLPKVEIPNRSYFLFHGRISDGYDQDADVRAGDTRFSATVPPAFAWPADHAWCVAKDVDPHWAGIGAAVDTIDDLIVTSGLDLVRTDPAMQQPEYR